MEIIAHIYNGFETKFGVPRQAGIVNDVVSEIVFEKKFRIPEAFRGLEDFSHIWVLWSFSEAICGEFSPTVRPPRLGGNKRMGVFATRSPFRPNSIGMSALKLEKITFDPERGPVLTVLGADMKNGTPIYDIKPYLPGFDSIPDAVGGFADSTRSHSAEVIFPDKLYNKLPSDIARAVKAILSHDPKPSYRHDDRIYGMEYSGYEIKFTYTNDKIEVVDIKTAEA
ncbi:MAG: tRNA (N6-threonylcarbamoyladenosine(37)-N6)-methyltransferase TrmO [Clostridia bacterium]|nr:tRNA (N6-threonylcarbamoyladenosine(37)-N6)-methyltransferase TrmO [Clostridia bacterium]